MVIIHSAQHNLDLTECITYSERTRTTHGKSFKDFRSRSLCQKATHDGRSRKTWETWISQNPLESHIKPVEIFSSVLHIRSVYVKQSPTSEKCSALWIMTVRPTNRFLFDKVLTPPLFPTVWTPLLYEEKVCFCRILRKVSTKRTKRSQDWFYFQSRVKHTYYP